MIININSIDNYNDTRNKDDAITTKLNHDGGDDDEENDTDNNGLMIININNNCFH